MRGMTTSSFEQTPQTVEPVPFGSPARPQHERDAEIVSSAANTTHTQVSAQLSSRLDDVEKQVRSAMADKVKGKELSPEEQSRHRNGTEVAVMLERRKEQHGLDYNGNRIVQADGTLKPTHADIINNAVKETTSNELAKLAQGNDGGHMRKVKSLVEAGRILAGTVGRMRGQSGMGIRLRPSPGSALAQGVPTYATDAFEKRARMFDKPVDESGKVQDAATAPLSQLERLHAAGQLHPDDMHHLENLREKWANVAADRATAKEAYDRKFAEDSERSKAETAKRFPPLADTSGGSDYVVSKIHPSEDELKQITEENAAQGLVGPLPHPDIKIPGGDGKANRGKGGAAKPNQSLRDYERMVYGEDYKSPANKKSGRRK
jgi:hypothetical protein